MTNSGVMSSVTLHRAGWPRGEKVRFAGGQLYWYWLPTSSGFPELRTPRSSPATVGQRRRFDVPGVSLAAANGGLTIIHFKVQIEFVTPGVF